MIAATNVLVIFWNFWCRIHYWCTAFWLFLKLRSISLLPNIDVVYCDEDELTLW